MMPRPPSRAMQMAVRASVTVSMAALTSGMFRGMLRDRRVEMIDIAGQNNRVSGHKEDVVKGKTFR